MPQQAEQPPSIYTDGQLDTSHPAVDSLIALGKVDDKMVDVAASKAVIDMKVVGGAGGNVTVFGWVEGVFMQVMMALHHFEQKVKNEIVDGVQTFRSHTKQEIDALCHIQLANNGIATEPPKAAALEEPAPGETVAPVAPE